jgi:hypothetical protein
MNNTPNTWTSARALDSDEDGDNDLYIVKSPSGNCYFSTNNGNGVFSNPVLELLPGSAGLIDKIDFNGDQASDLVYFHQIYDPLTGGPEPASIRFYWNDGNNDFSINNVTTVMLPEGYYRGVHIMDWNEDGALDLIVCYENQEVDPIDHVMHPYTYRYYSIGSNLELTLQKSTHSSFYLPWIYEDVNEDGHTDGIYYDGADGRIGWLDFFDSQEDTFHRLDQSVGASGETILNDLNDDMYQDLLVYNSQDASVGVYLNGPNGFGNVNMIIDAQYVWEDFHALDMDGDGDLDFVVLSSLPGDPHGTIGINTNGSFELYPFEHPTAENFSQYFADLNLDGRVDYIYVLFNQVQVHFSSSTGFFDGNNVTIDVIPGHLRFHDFNGDGLIDINSYQTQNRFYLALDESGTNFQLNPAMATQFGGSLFQQVIYYNDDDIPDLVFGENSTRIALGTGNGYQASFDGPEFQDYDHWCDYDGDGRTEYFKRFNINQWLVMHNVGGVLEPEGTLYGQAQIQNIAKHHPSTPPSVIDLNRRQLYLQPLQLIPDPLFVEGYVFWDMNADGIRQSPEPLLDIPFAIEENGTTNFTSATGQFSYLGDGQPIVISPVYDTNIWQLTTDSVSYHLSGEPDSWGQAIYFGFTPLNTVSEVSVNISAIDFACTQTTIELQVILCNSGNTLESGTLTTEWLQSLFPPIEWPTGSTVNANGFSLEIDSLLPTEHVVFYFEVEHPGVAYMDSLFWSTSTYTSNGLEQTSDYNAIIQCAYDPNMIIQTPVGMGQQGFVLSQQWMTYTIHFQNLGNAAASTVRIENPYSTWLDESQMEIIGSSHPMQYSYSEGHARFDFDEIDLLPASENEAGSKGFVTYRMPIRAEAPTFEPITNQALIYFDLNPAIVTNVACNQVFDCNIMRGWELTSDTYCLNDTMSGLALGSYISDYLWEFSDQENGYSDEFSAVANITGMEQLILTCSNELCSIQENEDILVNPLPEPIISQENNILYTAAYSNMTWEINGQPISGETNEILLNPSNGAYTVWVEDENGCTNRSSVWIENQEGLVIYPNPIAGETLNIAIEGSQGHLRIYHPSGRLIKDLPLQHLTTYHLKGWAAGLYILVASDELKTYAPVQLIVP